MKSELERMIDPMYLKEMPGAKIVSDSKKMIISNFTLDDYDTVQIRLTTAMRKKKWTAYYRDGKMVQKYRITAKDVVGEHFFRLPLTLAGLETIIINSEE